MLTRQFLRFLEGCGWCESGLEKAIRLQPLPPHHPQPALSLEDQIGLISAAPSHRTWLLVSLMLATGARPGELLNCDLGSVKEGQLQLRGKTGERWLPLPSALRHELEAEREARLGGATGATLPVTAGSAQPAAVPRAP